jgi:hypothetical protein
MKIMQGVDQAIKTDILGKFLCNQIIDIQP